ncbi:MAG: leucine-rich repeat domain-containing protein [Lachnospiraceae bacterium]|nr:leucine-rich repeat domain-containing protein [Lachnospiraceae bacterium]
MKIKFIIAASASLLALALSTGALADPAAVSSNTAGDLSAETDLPGGTGIQEESDQPNEAVEAAEPEEELPAQAGELDPYGTQAPMVKGYCGDKHAQGGDPEGHNAWYELHDEDGDGYFETMYIKGSGVVGDFQQETVDPDGDGVFVYVQNYQTYFRYHYPTQLKYIYIEGVSALSSYARQGTAALYMTKAEKIVFGRGVTSLESTCFSNGNVKEIEATDLKVIGDGAFEKCKKLEVIDIPDSVTTIGNNAFSGCENAREIRFGANVTTLGTGCFSKLPITSVTIPRKVTALPDNLFADCKNLSSVVIPEGVTQAGSSLFTGCSSLTQVTLPSTVRKYKDVFSGAPSIVEAVYPASSDTEVNILAQNCDSLKKLTIGEGIQKVGYVANNCPKLEQINLPASLKISTYRQCIKGCPRIKTAGPGSGYNLNYKWKDEIPSWFFSQSDSIQEITADGVTAIRSSAFYGNKCLCRLTVGASVELIEESVCYGCLNLGELTFAQGSRLKEIKRMAFRDCEKIQRVELPEGLQTIEDLIFSGCCDLSEVVIPASLTEIESGTFSGCPDIKTAGPAGDGHSYNVTLKNKDLVPKYLFCRADFLESAVLPENCSEIGYAAFSTCPNLRSVAIPNTVIVIGGSAFNQDLNLKNVRIPPYVEEIGSSAFNGCKKIKSMTFPATLLTLGYMAVPDNEGMEVRGYDNSPSDYSKKSGYRYVSLGKVCKVYFSDRICMKNLKTRYILCGKAVGQLPSPDHVQSGYQFLYWMDSQGNKYTASTPVPDEDYIYLYAHWIINGVKDYEPGQKTPPSVGRTFTTGGVTYRVTSSSADGTVAVSCSSCNYYNPKIVIEDTVNIDGFDCKVTAIEAAGFRYNVNLKQIVIGSNVKKIGKEAFLGCSKLKKITVKTRLLTKKNVGKKAFAGLHSKATVKAPSGLAKSYKKILKAKGLKGKKQKVK